MSAFLIDASIKQKLDIPGTWTTNDIYTIPTTYIYILYEIYWKPMNENREIKIKHRNVRPKSMVYTDLYTDTHILLDLWKKYELYI